MQYFISVLLMVFGTIGHAAQLENVNLEDNIKLGAKPFILNGIGLRKVYKFGIPVKVYVGGLYLEKANKDSDIILNSDETKYLVMHFVRAVDKDAIMESFRGGYEAGCFSSCDKWKEQFGLFSPHIVSLRKDNEIRLTFEKAKLTVEFTGPNAKTVALENSDLVKNLLSVFINKKNPPTKEFREGILGIAAK